MSDPGTTHGSIYIGFKKTAAGGVLLETGTDGTGDGNFSIIFNTNTLFVDFFGSGAEQRKTKAIADSNWHFLTVVFDTTLAAANQLVVKVDDSTSGVVTESVGDLASQLMGGSVPNIGARNNAASSFFTGSMRAIIARNVADNATVQSSYYAYWQYLQSLVP